MSYVEIAYKILKSEGEPLSARDITLKAINDGLLETQGKTPHATMWASLYLENQRRSKSNRPIRFRQFPNGIWGLVKWD